MYVYNRMKQNDHFNYEFRQKEIRERNQKDIARQQELQRKSNKRDYDDSYKEKSGSSFWDQRQGDNSKGSSDTQDTGYGGYKKEDQDRKRSQQQANQFDFDFNFQGSGSNNDNDEPRRGGGKRYDEDDDDDDNNHCDRGGASSGNNPSTFDFDNYTGDRGKDDYDREDRRRDRDYDRDKGDSGYGSKFDFDSYGGSRGDRDHDRDDYKYGAGSS